jgi:hypothetical protein
LRVEGEIRWHRIQALRIERQHILQTLNGLSQQPAHYAEQQEGERVPDPALFLLWINDCKTIDGKF